MLDLNLTAQQQPIKSFRSFSSSVFNATDTDDSCSYSDVLANNFAILNNRASFSIGESSIRTI